MEHEVFVPFPVDTVRLALAEPDRVARCVPGLQRDADEAAGPLSGRLRLRIGGSTITYRGVLRVGRRADAFEIEGEGIEARGGGSVKLTLTVTPKPVEGGTQLICAGTVHSEGRLAEFDDEASMTVARRMLDRFASALTAGLQKSPITAATEDEAPGRPTDGPTDQDTEDEATEDEVGVEATDAGKGAAAEESGLPTEAELPLSADDMDIDDVGDLEDVDDADAVEETVGFGDLADLDDLDDEPPAEAAHARRTMIGRSTEEVDHAPPRGRYAPVPAPETVSTSATLRWAAPAAAVVIASVVVVGRRVLRRRR
ncbi:carbon monoxide dehydrogenase subunit G [Streptomyces violaceusniger]|uniref:SRPBCC family protein n=2 Tax=Streptomyces violaceusniger group TaxID=2839105 RepID=A0ABD5JGP7_9ACTN|nr:MULTISPECIES: SRPBCC family protein [Streptomyces]KUL48841.1 carbon monoxide dehydrogenase subunit G [Streptomyces violaceusniger]MEE4586818.1 SRPBCC family protein [Streptomyces sp. DSM 41602]WJD98231.1 SRPBCC domain-containing protein [Streptomyces antimycoticus]